jgi:hypothetical protein
MCFVWLSEQTVTFAFYTIKRLVFITEVESVYSAVRTEFLYKTDRSRPLNVNLRLNMNSTTTGLAHSNITDQTFITRRCLFGIGRIIISEASQNIKQYNNIKVQFMSTHRKP